MIFKSKTFVLSLLSSSILFSAPLVVSADEDNNTEEGSEVVTVSSESFDLTVFHTNDIHASIDNFGKMSYFLTEQRAQLDNSLYLDAGDIFSGNPVVDLQDGEPIITLLNQMGLELMVVGNHEFDYGQRVFQDRRDESHFNWISANTRVVDSSIAIEQMDPYEIFEFDDFSVGVLGLTQNPPATNPAGIAGLEFDSYVDTALQYEYLRDEVDILIALNHIGYSADRRLAEEVDFFDLIIGGHSHTLLTEPQIVNGTPIVQAGSNSSHIGVVDLSIDGDTGEVSVDGRVQAVADLSDDNVDEEVQNLVDQYNRDLEEVLSQIVGFTNTGLSREGRDFGDVALGNMITDGIRSYVNADIAVTNNGGIRASIEPGDITARDVFTVDPFGNELSILDITGHDLKEVITYSVNRRMTDAGPGIDLQTSGLNYIVYYNDEDRSFAEVDLYINGEPMDLDQTYRLATNNFIASGGSGYDFSNATIVQEDAGQITSAIIQHLQDVTAALGAVDYATTEGRIQSLPISERAVAEVPSDDDEEPVEEDDESIEEDEEPIEEEQVEEIVENDETSEETEDMEEVEENPEEETEEISDEVSEEPIESGSDLDEELEGVESEQVAEGTTEEEPSAEDESAAEVETETELERLPETATVTWTVGLVGLGSIATGTAAHFVKKKK
ncbi:bifunctional metallophosphatase/5'-nucleotidase [Alkalibacterium pelagium]|uniref:2',3'-cyclic-nucleotide 2'-phosphodiesterase/5'-or 3'-nucleotidase, 5'-nucleotidase family n=1 Tax=Alkalibacterium pelagium TaxID=426702 RepID=A0A1H7PCA2_9LACT|nr:bifunctional UDP-sugar hydrolase/5'-nucleotidase [Alkalibacterium pelagium]GEN51604.1 hypothetical protein APE02nite_22690 [Alkalibacterium pelagium]SEL33266.1 2',3'-cyclic-nucleotide 2'-phosphodiesterase/5'-or 3'-nucleotidase, 5'-nucleotidase family [Alkalibacterium pelagium]